MKYVVLTATTLIALIVRGLLPDGTSEDSSGWRSVGGGVNWNYRGRGRALRGGGKAMRRNADDLLIGPIVVELRIDHVIALEGGLRGSGFFGKHGRIRDHGIVFGIDIIVFRAEDNITRGKVKERWVSGSRIRDERVFSVGNVLGEARRRVCGFEWRGEVQSGGISIGRGNI
jgi:hypothetical protein